MLSNFAKNHISKSSEETRIAFRKASRKKLKELQRLLAPWWSKRLPAGFYWDVLDELHREETVSLVCDRMASATADSSKLGSAFAAIFPITSASARERYEQEIDFGIKTGMSQVLLNDKDEIICCTFFFDVCDPVSIESSKYESMNLRSEIIDELHKRSAWLSSLAQQARCGELALGSVGCHDMVAVRKDYAGLHLDKVTKPYTRFFPCVLGYSRTFNEVIHPAPIKSQFELLFRSGSWQQLLSVVSLLDYVFEDGRALRDWIAPSVEEYVRSQSIRSIYAFRFDNEFIAKLIGLSLVDATSGKQILPSQTALTKALNVWYEKSNMPDVSLKIVKTLSKL